MPTRKPGAAAARTFPFGKMRFRTAWSASRTAAAWGSRCSCSPRAGWRISAGPEPALHFFPHDLVRKPVPTFRDHALLRHHLAAADIDAVGLQRTIRLLQRTHDGNMRARLELGFITDHIGADDGVGRHHDLLLASLIFDHQN